MSCIVLSGAKVMRLESPTFQLTFVITLETMMGLATVSSPTKILILLYFNLLIYNKYGYGVSKTVGVNSEIHGGSINDLFHANENTEYVSDEYANLKEGISLQSDLADKLFQKVKRQLLKQLERIKEKGTEIIPETTFQKITNNGGHLSESIVRKVHKHGVLIVRNTIPAEETYEMMSELIRYLYNNNMYPSNKSQTAFEIYWSKPQIRARQHPNMIKVQKALLMDLWHTNEDNQVDVDLRFI